MTPPASSQKSPPIRVLLIEDDQADAEFLREILSEEKNPPFEVEWVDRLPQALARLPQGGADVVLLDLFLRESRGLQTFSKVHSLATAIPVVVLTGLDDETMAVEAVRQGAQDYLVKGNVEGRMLTRVIRYAIERHRMQTALRSLSLCDDLTGLYNRRGFLTLAQQEFRRARRLKKGLFVFLADLDGLKPINDRFGHLEGDQALRTTAEILHKTFRSSDIIARIGGDEFAIIAMEEQKEPTEVLTRLQENIKNHNDQSRRGYTLGLSVGVSHLDPTQPFSIEELIGKADEALYEQKRLNQNRPTPRH